MTQGNNPVDSLLEWFQSLPPPIKAELAMLVLPVVPGGGADPLESFFSDDTPDRFDDWLEGYVHRSDEVLIGAVLAARAAIAFFAIQPIQDATNWATLNERHRKVWALFEKQGYPAFLSEEQIEDFRKGPVRQRMWLRAAETWRLLVAGPLSDDSLSRWLHRRSADE